MIPSNLNSGWIRLTVGEFCLTVVFGDALLMCAGFFNPIASEFPTIFGEGRVHH